MNMKPKSIWINSSLLVASLMFSAAIGEGLARIFLDPPHGYALYSKERNEAHSSLLKMTADTRLLHQVLPNSPGHDERGFRNEISRETAEIVAIGDSQTWGVNVHRDETWPSILEQIGKVSVYSMSLGGWGPLQYELLARDALALKPKAILVGMYFGNDIFDSCNHVYGTDAYPEYRRFDVEYVSALSDIHARLKVTEDQARVDHARQRLAEMGGVAKLWQGLARRSLIVQVLMTKGLLPAIPSVDELYETADVAWAQEHPEFASVYKGSNASTVLTFGYRGVAVDLENACIRDGVRITREVVVSLRALGARSGTQVGIVFIPTKEFVYATADQAIGKSKNGMFADLVKNEQSIKNELLDQCNSLGIVCIDASLWMVEAARKGIVLYRSDSDGHPIAGGYRQIALAGQQALKAMGSLER
jgi:lysophospholipase L1-like esterase